MQIIPKHQTSFLKVLKYVNSEINLSLHTDNFNQIISSYDLTASYILKQKSQFDNDGKTYMTYLKLENK